MIQELKLGNERVIAWRMEGKIEEAEYGAALDSLKKKMELFHNVNIYMEVPEISGLTPETIWDSLKFGFTNLKEFVKNIERVAVVTDKEWLKTYTSIESRLIPGVEERAFSFDDAEKAKQWVKLGV